MENLRPLTKREELIAKNEDRIKKIIDLLKGCTIRESEIILDETDNRIKDSVELG